MKVRRPERIVVKVKPVDGRKVGLKVAKLMRAKKARRAEEDRD